MDSKSSFVIKNFKIFEIDAPNNIFFLNWRNVKLIITIYQIGKISLQIKIFNFNLKFYLKQRTQKYKYNWKIIIIR